jgi:hypothetical protein
MIEIEYVKPASLVAYTENARVHPRAQLDQIKASISEFGFTNPILVDKDNMIIAGHGRHQAACELGLGKVPCIRLEHLTEEQKRTYILADNKIAENAEWDESLLAQELSFLNSLGDTTQLDLTGFSADDLDILLDSDYPESGEPLEDEDDNPYTTKVVSPIYEPKGVQPKVEELSNNSKTLDLLASIEKIELPEDVEDFLVAAAMRHTKFNYEAIAEYYAHAGKEVQELFEDSALVIIDFNKAIENGFVRMSQTFADLHGEANDENE